MVDSALKRWDVALSKRGTFGLSSVQLYDVRSFLLTEISEPDQSILIKHSHTTHQSDFIWKIVEPFPINAGFEWRFFNNEVIASKSNYLLIVNLISITLFLRFSS